MFNTQLRYDPATDELVNVATGAANDVVTTWGPAAVVPAAS